MKNKTILRVLSLALLTAFGLQDLAWAEGATGALSWPVSRKNGSIHLSKSLASTSRNGSGRSDWKIVHIQDAHDSLEAQRKITGILETLASQYDVRSVALEGSSGDIDPSLFKTYPDPAWAKRSAERLVEEGKLNAGEFFAVTSQNPVSVYGVEERTLYRANLKAFRDLLLNKEKIDRDLRGLSKTLTTLSERVYSEKIRWIRENSLFSDTPGLDFPKKWEMFVSLANEKNIDLGDYPSLGRLSGAAELERSIDFKRANQDREALIAELKDALSGKDLEELLGKAVRFKAGELSDVEFYQSLSDLARRSGSESSRYPDLVRYIGYLQAFDALDLQEVLREFEHFEARLKEALFLTDDERTLDRLEKNWTLVLHLLSGSASRAEYDRSKSVLKSARSASDRDDLQELARKYSVPLYEGFEFTRIVRSIPKALRFYALARKRDNVLLQNTLKRMRKDGQRVAALVTGGFHADGIAELLQKNELSHLVVLPNVQDTSKKRPYMTILTRRRGQFEKELAGPSARYKVVLGTGLDTAQANPYARVEEILAPLAEGIRAAGQNAGSRMARWMDEYEKSFRKVRDVRNPALEPRNVRKSLEKILGRHGEKRPETTRGARLAEAGDFIADNKINFDPRFNYRILKLAEKDPKDWTESEQGEYEILKKEIEEAHDWTRQEISRYPALIGHPPALLSLEGIVSAVERGKGPRLTSYHGGLGVLFGEWIRGIAYLGGVTSLDPDSKAPEFHIFIPDYEEGVTTSRVHAFGYPTLGARQIQRPQDHGIDFMKDPKDPSQAFQISIPLYDSGESIYIRFRTVKIGALNLIMPATDFEANHPAVRRIFEELYKGKPSSRERFEQEWVAGLAAFEFRKKMGIPLDGPVHLNETATFPYLIGLIRHYMEEGYSYEDSLKLVGSQLVFFTHTLVAAGIDHFHEDGVKMGHYIRSYFEKSSSEEVRKQAGNVARDMIHGRRSEDGKLYLPGFEESHRRNVYSPLHFVVRLAHSFNGTVVAVSQLNAIEAGKFFIQQGIITPEENAKKPVLGITNGVDHLFWMIREVRDVMNWQESEPEKRTPERILDPDDPEAKRLAALFDRTKEFGSIGEEPVLKDETLFEKLYENKKLAVEMVRNTVRDQYIRETGIIEEATRQNHVTHEELERLHVLRVRWAHWIGKENPQEWVKSWEGRPFEEQEPFRKELHAGELKGLMDPDLFLGVWARRIVNYKRILFTIFGHFLPEVEAQMPTDHALSPKELDDIILRLKNKGALNQFIELVVKKKAQFIFAGKAFSEDGRSSVALIHRLIELLSKEHPEFQDRVLFLEGYDETKSQYLVRGADTWINTPKRPLEASGTSGMKVAKGDIYSSPNGDGWGAGGIEDKLNGRVRGIIGTHQDHPDTWPASERENASNVSYYLGQEAAHFNEMMSEEIDRYNKAMAYFLKKDESQHFNAVEWLQQIRRWMYFTALVYDIRGEFTGRRVPSFRPEDVPGGDERGIFSLYEEAIAKTQALKRSIAEEKKAQGARLAGLYENRILGEINREKILYNGQENTKKLADSIRELIPDHENVTRLVYPASNFDDVTVASLIRVFPNIEEVFVVDFFGIPNYDLNDPRSRFTVERKKEEMQKMWSDNLNRVLKVFEIERKDLKLHVLVNDYYRAPEIAVKKARGLTVLIEKFPGYQAKMRGEAEFRQSILRDTRPGDLVFSVRGGHFEVLKWSQPPLAKNLSLPYLWDWQEKWDVTRLSQEDHRLSGARLAALPVPKRRENFESILEDLLAPKQNELAPLVTQYRNANGPLKKELDTKINAIIDEINLIRLSPGHKVEDIDIAPPSYYVDDFVRSGDYPRYRESAERMLLNGHYVPQFIFAGAATRLLEDLEKLFGKKLDPKSFRMYGLDLWSVLREAQKYDASLRTIQIPAETPALGMGPRQILAYRLLLEKLAAKYQMDVQKVLLAQRPVFNINEEIAEEVIEDFVGNKFYGMDPQKVIFIITPVFKGFNYADGKVTEDPQSPKLPYGHGYSTTQLAYAEAFTLTKDGEPRSLPVSALDILIENDPENDHVLGTHRINDATKFVTDEVVSLDRLALSLYLIREKKHGITIDLVGNPTHQKGGNNVRLKGESRSFLIETSNAKGSAYLIDPDPKRAQGLLDQAARQEAPYNAFRLTSTPRIYKDLIKRGIRYNVRWRSGNFYLESVTGDLTQLETSNSVAIQKKGDLIHDFKQISNYKDTVEFLKRQDREILDAEKTQGARLADRRGQKGSVARLAAERLDAAKNFYDYAVSVTISRNTFKDSALSTMLHKYSGTGALRRSQDLFDIYYPVFWKDTFNELSLELQKPQPNYFAIYTFLSITIAKTKPFLIFAEENSYSYLGLPSEEARRTFISSWKSGEAKLLEVLDVLKQAIPPDDRMPLSASSGNVQDDLREASGMLRRLARFYIDKAWEADPKERRSMYEAAGQIETPSFSSFAGKPREQFMLEVLNTAERIEEIETILLEYPSETIRSESLTTLHYLLDKRLGPMTQKVRLVGTGEEFNGFSILYHALLWTHAQGASQKLSDAIEKLTQGEGTSAGARLADPTRLQNVLAGISYFESEIGYLLDRTVWGASNSQWRQAAGALRTRLQDARKAMNSGDTQSAWHALSAAWAQFDQIPGEEFVFADYAVRRHQFEELFLNWSKAVDPIYAYYLMAAFALRELNAFEGHVQNSGVINKRAVIKRIQTLHRKIQNIQRIVLTVLTAERHSKIDPKEMDAALGSIARAVKEAWSASEKTVETVYSNDRKKVFSGSKFNDPQLPLTSSFYRLVAEMKVYSDSLPKGARLAGPSKTIEVIFDQMLRTAERVRSTDVPEERKRAAVEFLDSMPFKITIDVHAEIERFLGEEGRSINDYQKALDTIQTVFSGMEPAERSRLLDLVVKAAQSTRGNLIVGLARPLRARFSDLRLPKGARLSQQTLVSVKDLRGNLSFIQELLKIKRKEEASARQQTSDILDRVLPRFLLWTVSGTVLAGLVASGGDHSSLATGVFTAGFSIGALQVLLPLRPSETKRRILREEISSLAAEEHSLKARIYEFFTAEPDRDYSKLIQRSLTRVEEIANVDRQNPDRPHLTDRVKRLIVQVIRFERQVEAGYPFWSSAAQKAAIDRSYEEVIRKLGSILLDSAEYIEGDGQDTDLAARIEVFGVAGAGESINDFFRAVQGELPLPEDRAGARLASLNQLTGGILTQAFYAARILNLKKALDSLWSDHEATGFIRRTPAESDIRKSVGPFIIGQIDMSEKFRGTIRQIGPEDLEEFSRTFGLATPAYVLRSMIRGIVNRVSPPLTKKCPLCEANFPLTESALRWKGHLRWNITPNPFPILNAPEDRHFVVAAVDHTPQVLDQKAIEDMVALAREAKDHRILFNGIGAGSSVPSHRHIQMVTYPFPIENEYYFPLQTVKRDGEVFTYRVNHYPRELYAFQSSNASALARTIHEKIAVLQLRQIPYDLLFVRQDYGPVRAYLFALNPKRRYGFSGVHQSSGYIFAPAQNAAGEPVGLYDELNPDSYPGSPEEREDRALEAIKGYLKDTLHPIEMWELLEVPIEGARLATAQEQPLRETSVRVERPGKDAIKVVIRKKVDPSSIQSDAVELELSLDSDEADAVRFTIERPMNESPDTLASLVQRYIRENDIVLEASISPESEEAVRLALSTELDMIEDLYTIQRDPRGVNYDQVKYFVDEFYRMLEKRIFHNHSPSGEQEKAIRKELREILEESIKNAFESIQVRFMHEDDTTLKDVPEEKRPLQEGEIHVMLVPEGDRLMFRIVDDGMGVHPEVLRLTERESKNREEDEKDWLSGWMERWEKYYQSSIKHNHPEQFLELSGQGKGLMMIEHFSHDKMIQGTWTLKDRSRELKDKTGAIFTYHFNFNGKVAKKNGGARLAKAGDYKAALDKITTSFSEGIDSFLKNPSLTEVSLQSILQYENQKITDLVPSAQRGAARKELEARIKTVLVAKNFEPTSDSDIYKVPAAVRKKLLQSQKSGARLAQNQSMIQSLRQSYLRMQSAFEDELKAAAPSADVIVVTAYDDRMKKLYEDHLAGLSGVTYRKDVPVLVVTNPILNGKVRSAGSGGMLSRSLRAVDDALPSLKGSYPHLRLKTGLDDLNILIVQGGGLGERMLFSAVLGSKTLTPLPVSLGDGRQATLLDMAMMAGPTYTQALTKRGRPGVVTLAGDIVSVTKPQLKDGLNLLGAPKTPVEVDRRLGVITQSESGQVHFIEKPSLEQIALDPRLRGQRYLLANAANSVLTHSDKLVYRRALDTFLRLERVMRDEFENTGNIFPVDTSIDILEPRAAGSMKEALQKRSEDDEERKEYYASIYGIVREGLPDLVVPRQLPSSSYFIDFASVSDWLDVMAPESVLSQMLGRSFTSSDRAVLHKIIPARGESRWKYLLFGVGRSVAYISDDQVMLKVPVRSEQGNGMAIVYVNLKDRLEKTVEKGTLFGRPASYMLDSWKIPYGPYDQLLDVAAWPVVPENLMGHLASIQGLSKGRPTDLYGYLPKISIRQIQRSVAQGARLAESDDLARSRWMDEVTVKKDGAETPWESQDNIITFDKLTERLKVFENDTPDNDVKALEIRDLDERVVALRRFKKQVQDYAVTAKEAEKRDAGFYLVETARLLKEAEDQRNVLNFYSFSGDEQRLILAVGWAVSGRDDLALQTLLSDAVTLPSVEAVRAFVSQEGSRYIRSEGISSLLSRYGSDLQDKNDLGGRLIGKNYNKALEELRSNKKKAQILLEIASRVEAGDRVRLGGRGVVLLERIVKGYVLYRPETDPDAEQEILDRKSLESAIHSGRFDLLPRTTFEGTASSQGARLAVVSKDTEQLKKILNNRTHRFLTADETKIVFEAYRGAEYTEKKLIEEAVLERYWYYVLNIAKRLSSSPEEAMDNAQEGYFGFTRAMEKYDLRRNVAFSTYLKAWVEQAIRRARRKVRYQIRLPNYAHDLLKKINAAIEQVFKDTGKEPTTERISELTGIPVKHVIEVRAASRSLTMPTSGNSRGEWENLAKWLGDSKTLSPDWRMRLQDEEAEKGLALRLIQELEPQRRLITKLRNGIGTEEGKTYTLREISEILGSARENGLTRERVRQLEEKAIERLRERMENEERPASVSVIDHTDVFLFETLKLSPRHDDYELFYNLGKDELKRRIESLKEKDTKLAELQKDPYLLLSVETADMPAGARLSEDTIQFQDGTPIVRIQRAASSRPALVGVRSGAVGREIQGALGDRKDIEIVHLYPHSKPEDMLKQFDAVSGSLDASFGIIVDDEDLNADSKKEFLKRFHALDLRSRPVLAGLLNGTTRIQDLTEAEKKDLVTVLSDILPAIAPRSWSKTETRHESAEELWFDMKLQLFHPSFGSSIGELPGFADRSPRAAVWSLDAILKDPLILRTLQDRDRKLSGRMRIDDYLLSDTIDEEELEKRLVAVLGERTAESLMIRFADRLIQTGEVAAVVARKLQSKQGYKPEYILFVDTDAKRSVLRAKGEAYQALYLRGEYALTLDKVATQILAAGTGAKNLFIKGLQMDGEGNFIFTPILPIDFERHFKDFYQSLKQILQAA